MSKTIKKPDWHERNPAIEIKGVHIEKARALAIKAFPGEIATTTPNGALIQRLMEWAVDDLAGKEWAKMPEGGTVTVT